MLHPTPLHLVNSRLSVPSRSFVGPPTRPRVPAVAGSPAPLALALAWVLLSSAVGWGALLWQPVDGWRGALLLVGGVLAPAAGLWVVGRAGLGSSAALAAMVVGVVALSDLSWRAEGSPGSGLDLQSLVKLALWGAGLLLLAWRWRALLAACRQGPTAAFGLFGLWCLASTLWSATPAYTAGVALAFLGVWVLATLWARQVPLRTGLLVLTAGVLAAVAGSLLVYLVWPERALTPNEGGRILRLSGLFGSPNNLGRAAALGLLLVALVMPGLRRGHAWLLGSVALAVCGSALVLTGSRGSVTALALGLGVVWLARRPVWALLAALAGVFALLVWTLAPETRDALIAMLSRSGRATEVTSLTGRTQIWQAVWELIGQAPVLGHGFASTREVLPAHWAGAFGWTTTSAHNLWLQVWVMTGALGLLLWLAAQAGWLWQACTRHLPARDAVVVFVLAVGVLEASAAGPSVNLMSFALLWAVALRSPHADR
jgi:O-antigen ligase